jgi:uncharacterized protein (TIRG00374 family)
MLITFRWREILSHLNNHYHFTNLLRCFWIGFFFNQILLSNIGGDLIRGRCIYKNGVNLKNSILSILIDRLFGIVGLSLIVLSTTPLLPFELNNSILIVVFAVLFIVFTIMVMNVFFTATNWKLIRGLHKLSYEFKSIMFNFSLSIRLVATSFLVHVLGVAMVITLSEGLGLDINWVSILIVTPLVSLLMIIPISIAGWGVREGGMVVGLGFFGVPMESSLALSILYGISTLLVSLPGLLLWIFGKNTIEDNFNNTHV